MSDERTALHLMRMALALLDRVGERAAAARLQHAIDCLEPGPGGEPDQDAIDRILGPTSSD